ncbi:MAG: hypothetical protein M1832_002231 [Thelocarpon impressellum]|nr:MAG: hypothetical protein M1832_002231 [Thelocarpon impressellum]
MRTRQVTPIYPADANLIVSLLDLHMSRPSSDPEHPLEILEAGTGHGSLTLHLARAIHAANTTPPCAPQVQWGRTPDEIGAVPEDDTEECSQRLAYAAWARTRNAKIHTVDASAQYSAFAQGVVHGFRQGLYYPHVDFHKGDVSAWLTSSSRPNTTFLAHAILDLPSSHTHLRTVARALHTDGALLAFNPSVSQIGECVRRIRAEKLPLALERVLELGNGGSSGGREWDVRAVRPRALSAPTTPRAEAQADPEADGRYRQLFVEQHTPPRAGPRSADDGWEMVCRPKVGDRVTGGGFLGVWRKMRW